MNYSLEAKSPSYNFTIFLMILLVTLAKFSINLGFSLKPYMIFLLLFLVIHVSSFYFHKLQSFEIAMLMFYFVYSYTGAFALYPESSLRILLGITLYLFCYFVMKSILSQTKTAIVEKVIGNVGIIFNMMSLFLYFMGLKSASMAFEDERIASYGVLIDRHYPRLIGLLQDPNFYVFYNTLFFAYYLCNPNSWKNRIGLVLCIATNLLTFSRGGMLALVIMFAVYLLLNNPIKQLKIALSSLVSLLLLVYFSIVYLKFDVMGIIEARVNDFSNDGGSGRFELWGRAWDFFASNIFMGLGAFNFSDYNTFLYGDSLTVHNTFLDILSESGLLGFSFYLAFILLVFLKLIKENVHHHKPYLFLTYIGYVLQMVSLSVIINDMFFMYIAILSTYLLNREKLRKTGAQTLNH